MLIIISSNNQRRIARWVSILIVVSRQKIVASSSVSTIPQSLCNRCQLSEKWLCFLLFRCPLELHIKSARAIYHLSWSRSDEICNGKMEWWDFLIVVLHFSNVSVYVSCLNKNLHFLLQTQILSMLPAWSSEILHSLSFLKSNDVIKRWSGYQEKCLNDHISCRK